MENVNRKLIAVDRVRRTESSLAAKSVAAAMAGVSEKLSGGRSAQISQLLAEQVVRRILGSLDDLPRPTMAELPPGTASLSPELVCEVSRIVTDNTWAALVEDSPAADLSVLLRRAQRVFEGAHEVREAALRAPETSGHAAAVVSWAATADLLVRGEDADDFARQANVRLASSYVVAVVDRRASPPDRLLQAWPALECRRDVLATPDGDELVILMPALKGVHRDEVRSHAEEVLRLWVSGKSPTMVGSAAAQDRSDIPAAVAEARGVLHVVQALQYPDGVYHVDDVPVEVSLMRSPDLAELLTLRLLPLYSSGAPLLETLRTYMETSQDRRQAAAALHVHSNTLDYRLRRIRELTGLSPSVPRDIQTLGAALIAWRLQRMSDEV